ncbi:UDP-galactose transporter [Sistotremastrum niveocremeum HHB9708]|uniref:UDP-galactose transporter homolog 1 n=2 Tax=Sistotremastraceae TaxID=3402574 RepID=A0A164RGZ3_9AGAM|nr:UDP-galactose transporter [Sistotremastrum niveocremeum HHB9708]KZT31261.1 UDP-galactose transporter [Sistotremastrum suecicum HHB10207 ss-3]
MSFLRLFICVTGVYAMFLAWGIAQERLSAPFVDGAQADKWSYALVLGFLQSSLGSLSALSYIALTREPSQTIWEALCTSRKHHRSQHQASSPSSSRNDSLRSLLFKYLQCALLATFAAPFGFASLAYISYPAMVLGKSCKLVPVLIMNVLLYRRRFTAHKYGVVALVTIGITMFMALGAQKPSQGKSDASSASSIIGLIYLLINLAMDGILNATQDEIFVRYQVSGQQMMFFMNTFSALLNLALSCVPLPYIPVLHPESGHESEITAALRFMHNHPSVVSALAIFAITGSLGQLFIFETIQHFGSLTLVTVTLTRKLFTMLLSVVVYQHKLTVGQYAGACVVFGGISIEAWVKRKAIHTKRVIQEKEKAKIKVL